LKLCGSFSLCFPKIEQQRRFERLAVAEVVDNEDEDDHSSPLSSIPAGDVVVLHIDFLFLFHCAWCCNSRGGS